MINNQLLFCDLGFKQHQKHGQDICGDAFKYEKLLDENRIIAVLSDGLGSGVKANILASMTATMAVRFAAENMDFIHYAEIMMSALPICKIRKISYATFTIVDVMLNGKVRVVEMGNPAFILLREGQGVAVPYKELVSEKWENRTMYFYEFEAMPNDRLIFCSDGISQAGMGTDKYPLGWREVGCQAYLEKVIAERRDIAAHDLSDLVIREALRKEPEFLSVDDMTCAVIYFRTPRQMVLLTGPPFDRQRDVECAQLIDSFAGDKVICGGTTAEIVARELARKLTMDLRSGSADLPPASEMAGVDLITEGIFTLTKTASYLEVGRCEYDNSPAAKLVKILLRNDIIVIWVGTRINEAHQDPNLPLELEIRRNIIRRIADILRKKYLKEVNIKYV
jgi:serine/threonine protein phosphatase PrpC